jgi:peptide-methionine (R)-S-oxide reductase
MAKTPRTDRIEKTDAEWRQQLSPEAYNVARKHGTERAFTSPLNEEKREGMFKCIGCGEPVFDSATKFDSGTGWPSFYAPAGDQSIETSTDYYLIYPRTEVHCARCQSHLGHVFKDGPKPTGLRYCINGVALTFEPKKD